MFEAVEKQVREFERGAQVQIVVNGEPMPRIGTVVGFCRTSKGDFYTVQPRDAVRTQRVPAEMLRAVVDEQGGLVQKARVWLAGRRKDPVVYRGNMGHRMARRVKP